MSNKNNIQGLFKFIKEALGNHEVPYNEGHWAEMDKMLDKEFIPKAKGSSGISGLKIFLSSIITLVSIAGITLTYFYFNSSITIDQKQTTGTQQQVKSTNFITKNEPTGIRIIPTPNQNSSLESEHKTEKQINSISHTQIEITSHFPFIRNENATEKNSTAENLFPFLEIVYKSPSFFDQKNNSNSKTNNILFSNPSLQEHHRTDRLSENNPKTHHETYFKDSAIRNNKNNIEVSNSPFNSPFHSTLISENVLDHNPFAFIPYKNSFLIDSLHSIQNSISRLNNSNQDSISKPCDTCIVPFFADPFIYPMEYIKTSSFSKNSALAGIKTSIYNTQSFFNPISEILTLNVSLGKKEYIGIGEEIRYSMEKDTNDILSEKIISNTSISTLITPKLPYKIRIGAGLTHEWIKNRIPGGDFSSDYSFTYSQNTEANIGILLYTNKYYLGMSLNSIPILRGSYNNHITSYHLTSGLKILSKHSNFIIPHINIEYQVPDNDGRISSPLILNNFGIDWVTLTKGFYLHKRSTNTKKNTEKFEIYYPEKTGFIGSYIRKKYNIKENDISIPEIIQSTCVTRYHVKSISITNLNTLELAANKCWLVYNNRKHKVKSTKHIAGMKYSIPLTKNSSYYPNIDSDILPIGWQLSYGFYF